jgi:hypothetical protein
MATKRYTGVMKTLPLLGLLTLAACTKDAPPRPPAAPAPAPTLGESSSDSYSVSLNPRAPYATGKEASAVITVNAKTGFHVNPDYPAAFKVVGSEKVRFEQEHIKLTAGTKTPCADKAEDSCTVEFPLVMTPEQGGAAKIAGVVSFSVCSPDKCLIQKVPLTLPIVVD